MKTSVIFAILQMSIGILLKGMNSLYFRHKLDFFFEFIPQIILLLVLFGWMDILIIGKWSMEKNINVIWDKDSQEYVDIHKSPAIITTMIDIFLSMGNNVDTDGS
jgi:V-type H+-transporting ATPase subunit a